MPSGEEEEIAERGRLPVFLNAGAARAFLAFFTNLQSHSGSAYGHDDESVLRTGLSSMLEPEPLRNVSAHAGNDPSRAKCRLESTAEPVKCVAEAAGFGDAENMRRIQPPGVRRCTTDRARSLRRHAAELGGSRLVLDSGGTGSLNRWTASFAFALR